MRNSGIWFKISIIIFFFFSCTAYAYEGKDHERMNKYICENPVGDFSLDSFLKEYLGFIHGAEEIIAEKSYVTPILFWDIQLINSIEFSVEKCLGDGGKEEDTPILRCERHFHNPLVLQWDDAGLKGIWESLICWMQDEEQSWGSYSWRDVRLYYYNALIAVDPDEQAGNYVKAFEGLGRQMHLIQDASVPLHTRDDGHLFYSYEKYIKKKRKSKDPEDQNIYNGWLSDDSGYTYDESVLDLDLNPLAPIPIARIVDTDKYEWDYTADPPVPPDPDETINQAIGLAEYSNANFFSKDTIFKTDKFPFPSRDSVEQAEDVYIPDPRDPTRTVTRQFYKKTQHGDTGYRLCTVPVYDEWITADAMLDDNVYDHYAQRLIPRAVSYSAGLLKYFFRGTIDIDSYTVSDPDGHECAQITFFVKNTSGGEDGTEEMIDGSIELVIHYWPSDEIFQYVVIPEAYDARSIQRETTKLVFDLGDNPPPVFSEKCSFYLVYRGELGLEDDAVCVGYAGNKNNIEITLPETGVYALQESRPDQLDSQGFNHIKLLAQNVSTGGMELPDGSIEVVIQYRVSDDDPFVRHTSYPNPSSHRVHYITATSDVGSIPRDNPMEIDFDLGDEEIPLWAYDIGLYVVYRGASMLDDELVDEYSQVVGFKDISEPTPITIVNHTDKVKLFGQWYDTGLDALAVVDDADNSGNGNGYGDEHTVFPRTFENIYVRFSPDDGTTRLASSNPDQHNCCIPRITAGHYVMFYVLSDYVFNFSGSGFSTLRTSALDMWNTYYRQNLYTVQAFRKQVVFNAATGRNTFYTPYFWRIRGGDFCGHITNYCMSGYPGSPRIYASELCSQQPDILDEYDE